MKTSEIPACISEIKFENRGPILVRANQIAAEIKKGSTKYSFKKLIRTNLGNPFMVGMKPFTFIREVVALSCAPHLLQDSNFTSKFYPDVVARAKWFVNTCTNGTNIGPYSPSTGWLGIRKHICEFIMERDIANAKKAGADSSRIEQADPDNIIMTAGATMAVSFVLNVFLADTMKKPGLMSSVPTYPLYNVRARIHDAHVVPYYLDEANQWNITIEELDRSYDSAVRNGVRPVVLEIINPGNPTGSILTRDRIKDIIAWSIKKNIALIADEVYQGNVYTTEQHFHSFREVLYTEFPPSEAKKCLLISMHSASKEVGECGSRGSFMEILNAEPEVMAQLVKMASIHLAPNNIGQLIVDLMVRPPKRGDASYERHQKEKNELQESLKRRARYMTEALNKIPGIATNTISGAMYAYPSVTTPLAFQEEAKKLGRSVDFHWCSALLEAYGIIVVPGTGFGQQPGTVHFRTTILPQQNDLEYVVRSINDLQNKIINQYGPLPSSSSSLPPVQRSSKL